MAARPRSTAPPGPDPGAPERLRGADAVRLHATLVAGLPICVGAFVFEVVRALGGNSLSWAYVFEWPIFAVFALYMWWNLLHGTDGRRRTLRGPSGLPGDPTTGVRSGRAGSGDGRAAGSDDPDLRGLAGVPADPGGRRGRGRAGRRPD